MLSMYSNYLTINISSPNTEGLRNFHNQQEMDKLLTGLNKIRKEKKIKQPFVIKLSPDISHDEVDDIVRIVKKHAKRSKEIITTISR